MNTRYYFFYSLLIVTLKVIQSDLNQIEGHPNVVLGLDTKLCLVNLY